MRLALIANHRSGSGRDPQLLARQLREAAPREQPVEVELHPIDEVDLLADADADARPDRLVVAGGDGSIAPAAALARDLNVDLALLPVGTANDFARAMRIPRNLPAALRLAADPEARTEPCELGWIDRTRPFVNVASLGLASVAARRAKPLKSRLGPLAYAVGAAHAGATATPLDARVTADRTSVYEGHIWQIVVAVTGAFGAGSGVGGTDPEDGLLDLVVIPSGSRAGLARRAWGLRTHTIDEQRGVLRERARRIELTSTNGEPLELNVDGELIELGKPSANLTARARAFRVCVP